MRPDVKLGIAASLVVVVVAGGYFLYRDSRETPVPLSEAKPAAGENKGKVPHERIPSQTNRTAPNGRSKGTTTPDRRSAGNGKRRSRNAAPTELGKAVTNGVNPDNADGKAVAGRGLTVNARERIQPTSPGAGVPAGGSPVPSDSSNKTATSTPEKRSAAVHKPAGLSDRRAVQGTPENPEPLVAGAGRTLKRTDRFADRKPAQAGDLPTMSPSATSPSVKTPRSVNRAGLSTDAAMESHRAQPGDSFASLAREYYGDEKYTQFLADHNGHITDPGRLQVGALINIPPAPQNPTPSGTSVVPKTADSKISGSTSSRTYTVRSGDSFYGIARDVLGDAVRWKELFELNRGLVGGDPKKLQVGHVIALPQT